MSRAKVLVCGATGFIGRNIAEAIAEDDTLEVIGTCWSRDPFDNPNIRFVCADLRDATQVDEVLTGIDIVIQAAATTSGAGDIVGQPHIHITDNAVMNSLLLRGAFNHKVKQFVYFSCTLMYPSTDRLLGEEDFDANLEFDPRYFGPGWTKVYIEKMCEFYSRIGETKFTVLRHSNIYGPHDKFDLERSHVFGATVTKVLTNDSGCVVVWGDGSEERDLLHVSDLVNAVRLALQRQTTPYRIYNIGTGEKCSVNRLVEMIIAASGRDLAVEFDVTKPTIRTRHILNAARADQELGWRPKVNLQQGIAHVIDWYRRNFNINTGNDRVQ